MCLFAGESLLACELVCGLPQTWNVNYTQEFDESMKTHFIGQLNYLSVELLPISIWTLQSLIFCHAVAESISQYSLAPFDELCVPIGLTRTLFR